MAKNTKTIRMNMEINISQNFNTVKLGFVDEPIEFDESVVGSFEAAVRQLFTKLRTEAKNQHALIAQDFPRSVTK